MFKSKKSIGIGIDIEHTKRFERLHRTRNAHFLKKIFTGKELTYCFSKKQPAQHLAARFAAKEAIIKAINPLSKKAPALNEIEIVNNANGVPMVMLKGYDIKISLSHCGDIAIAFALVFVMV